MKKVKFLVLLVIFLIFWNFWVPGPRAAGDLPYSFPENQAVGFALPSSWTERLAEGLGEYTVATLWAWPVDLVFSLGGRLGLSFDILERIFGVLPFLLIGIYGISKLFEYFKIQGFGKWVGTLFYLANTYILLVIDGGQFHLALAYSTLPLCFLLYRQGIEIRGWQPQFKFSLSVLALSIFDIRIVYLLFLLIVFDFIFTIVFNRESPRRRIGGIIWRYSLLGTITGLVLVGFHMYWILPAIFAKLPSLPLTYERPEQVEFLSFANLGHSLYLLSPHWFKNVFGQVTALRWEFVLIPILVFLAPVLKPKDRWVGFWLLVALGGVFLAKGSNGPFPEIYPWLFANIPGFSLFRDPTKFFFLVALAYSVLVGTTVAELAKKFNRKLEIRNWRIALVPILLTSYFLLLVHPVYTGKMTGTFSKPIYQDEFFGLAKTLRGDSQFGRVFWIPTKAPLGYSSPVHPSVEAARLVQKRPFATGVVGTYELFNFVREAPYMGELFDIAGIRYIIYPFPDTRREELKPDNVQYYYTFLSQIAGRDWATPVATDSPVPIVQVKNHQDHFFIAPNIWWVVGSDDIYRELVEISGFRLADNGLVFVEEQAGLGRKIDKIPSARILLNKKSEIDLAASFVQPNELIFPARNLDFEPNETGWWKREAADLISWRAFLQEKYGIDNLDFSLGGGWAVGEGNVKLQIANGKLQKDSILLARVLESTKSGELVFRQADKVIGKINTKKEGNNVRWFEVGKITIDNEPLIIEAQGDINVVNALAVVDKKEWEAAKKKALQLIEQGRVFVWSKLGDNGKEQLFSVISKPKVSYTTINPTKYKVSVSGLENPAILAFSETFDPLWQAKIEEKRIGSLPLYSLINGFTIQSDGEYVIEFSAQRYVLPGLVVSGTTFILALLILFLV